VSLTRNIANEARVLGLRLRLSLVDLAAIERWADRAILDDDGSNSELVDLCMARKVGDKLATTRLATLGGEPAALDVVRALGAVKVEAQSPDELRRLADNLDPILKRLERAGAMPDILKPATRFATDFWHARIEGGDRMAKVEAEMRELLHDVKEYAAELPAEGDGITEPHAQEDARISAIVVSYRTGEVLFDCLAALESDPAISEIMLVDNGNPVETLERVKAAYGKSAKLKIIGGGVNRGFAAGVNLGAAQAGGNRFLVINPDAVLQPGSIAALEAARAEAAEPVVVGGKIFGLDGAEQRGARRRRLTMRSAAVTFLGMSWLRRFNPAFVNINLNNEPPPSGPVQVDAVSGALMYLSRAGFERLGGFDAGYFLHVEDLDLCRRADAEGGSVIYTPLAAALHHGATSAATAVAVERHKAAGLGRYFKKFAETPAEKLAAAVLGPVILVALVVRARVRGE
jgi:N-acetylglucosaminyl-diphospho-decaprenol L-rhamnosyltransferase